MGGQSPLQDSLSAGPSLSLHDRTLVPSLVLGLSVAPPVQWEEMNVTGGHGCMGTSCVRRESWAFYKALGGELPGDRAAFQAVMSRTSCHWPISWSTQSALRILSICLATYNHYLTIITWKRLQLPAEDIEMSQSPTFVMPQVR